MGADHCGLQALTRANDLTTTNQEVIGKSLDTTGCAMVNSR
jgi:hypothetical protein